MNIMLATVHNEYSTKRREINFTERSKSLVKAKETRKELNDT